MKKNSEIKKRIHCCVCGVDGEHDWEDCPVLHEHFNREAEEETDPYNACMAMGHDGDDRF